MSEWFKFEANWNENVAGIPKRDWEKKLGKEVAFTRSVNGEFKTDSLKVWVVEPQAHIIAATMPVGLLAGYAPDAVLVHAFTKNYKTAAKPGVVSNYGFEKNHGEPIELLDYVFETVFDRACEAEINRYRHNSKNYESGRYVDYVKHGITIIIPHEDDILNDEKLQQEWIEDVCMDDLIKYTKKLDRGWKKQHARRVFGTYLAVEADIKTNLRSLVHMGKQRSGIYSPNGREAEPEISRVVTHMIDEAMPYLPVFASDVLKQIGKGYR